MGHRRSIASRLVHAAGILLGHAAVLVAGQAPTTPTPPRAEPEHVEVSETLLTPTTEGPSGTAWLPRATPMYGVHRSWHGWDLRLDGAAFVQEIYEPGDRHRTGGAATHQAASVNWGMVMARRRTGAWRIGLRAMVSAEPLTVPGCGALNLVATGEVCDGDTIHDREQPHDLVSELALDVDHPLRGAWRWAVYAGLAGDPAFGPPPHPHRLSAAFNPIAPVTHHWIEPSAAFGVVTAGIHDRRWKTELSAFNSRAPDERRGDLDLGGFDAISARISYLPTDRLALQASVAHLQDARGAFERPPDPAGTLVSVSATYHRPLAAGGLWASTLAGGLRRGRENIPGGIFDTANGGAAAETSVTLAGRHTIFGRAEIAAMPAHHLHAHEYAAAVLPIGKLQAGYVRLLAPHRGAVVGVGGTASVSVLPPELAPRYGGQAAPGFALFVAVRAAGHVM
jgi:hypothetical protein